MSYRTAERFLNDYGEDALYQLIEMLRSGVPEHEAFLRLKIKRDPSSISRKVRKLFNRSWEIPEHTMAALRDYREKSKVIQLGRAEKMLRLKEYASDAHTHP